MQKEPPSKSKPSIADGVLAGLVLSVQFTIATLICGAGLNLLGLQLPQAVCLTTLIAVVVLGFSLPFGCPTLSKRFLEFFSQNTLS